MPNHDENSEAVLALNTALISVPAAWVSSGSLAVTAIAAATAFASFALYLRRRFP
jgi:EamA domain-containing membrane protein RarD